MRKLTCPCEQVFNVDIPEVVNLDSSPEIIVDVKDGSFLTCICPTCNAELHTDLKTRFEWPSKGVNVVLIPEIDRYAFLSGKLPPESDAQITIGFAELADRISVLENNLNPLVIESIKFHLAEKALEKNPDAKLTILFETVRQDGILEFHIHGLKTDEVAITNIPRHLYDTLINDVLANPDKEPYVSLRNGDYLSVQNILIEDGQHE